MADDVLDILVRLTGDYQILEDLLSKPHDVRLNIQNNLVAQQTAQAQAAAQSLRGQTPAPGPTLSGIDLVRQEVRAREALVGLNNRLYEQEKAIFTQRQKAVEANQKFALGSSINGPSRQQVALQYGLIPSQITAQRRLFDASRITQTQSLREIAFAGLFGQGLVGRGVNIAGGVVGAGVGGPGGALAGSALAQVASQEIAKVFDVIAEGLRKAAEAGITFERSILGIASVFQATTGVRGAQGQSLSLGEQLNVQQGEARQVQRAARARLLPLGISGEKEATLVQAIISGAAQRGINLSPEQAGILAERIGGALQAQRPEILDNPTLLRRDIEDALSGAPSGKRTILGTLIRGYAPGLFTASSGADLVNQSQGLAAFPEALKNSNNPITAINKLDAALDNLATTVGDKFLISIVPAFKALTEILTDPQLTTSVASFAESLGGIVSSLAGFSSVLAGIAGIVDRISSHKEDILDVGLDAAYLTKIAQGDFKGASAILQIHQEKTRKQNEPVDKDEVVKYRNPSSIYGGLKATLGDLTEPAGTFDAKNPFAVIASAVDLLNSIPEIKFGIKDKANGNKKLEEAGLKDLSTTAYNATSAVVDAHQDLFEKGQKLFGKDLYSQIAQNHFSIEGLGAEIGDRQSLVSRAGERSSAARSKLSALSNAAGPAGPDPRELEKAERELAKARQDETAQTEKLIQAQNSLAESVQKSISLIQEETQFKLKQVNLQTQVGQTSGLNIEQGGLDAGTSKIVDRIAEVQAGKGSSEELQFLQGQLRIQGVSQEQLNAKKQLRPGEVAGNEVGAVKALDDLQNSAFNAAKATKEMADAVYKTSEALKDFDKETRLRDLERQDAVAGSKERLADAIDKAYGAGSGDALREDPQSRAFRQLDLAKEQYDQTYRINGPFGEAEEQDRRARAGLVLDKQGAEINQTELPYNLASQQIGDIQKVIQLAQQFPENKQLQDAAKQAQSRLPQLLQGLGFGSAGSSIGSLFGSNDVFNSAFTQGQSGFGSTYTSDQVNNAGNFAPGGYDQTKRIEDLISTADFSVNDAVININQAYFNSLEDGNNLGNIDKESEDYFKNTGGGRGYPDSDVKRPDSDPLAQFFGGIADQTGLSSFVDNATNFFGAGTGNLGKAGGSILDNIAGFINDPIGTLMHAGQDIGKSAGDLANNVFSGKYGVGLGLTPLGQQTTKGLGLDQLGDNLKFIFGDKPIQGVSSPDLNLPYSIAGKVAPYNGNGDEKALGADILGGVLGSESVSGKGLASVKPEDVFNPSNYRPITPQDVFNTTYPQLGVPFGEPSTVDVSKVGPNVPGFSFDGKSVASKYSSGKLSANELLSLSDSDLLKYGNQQLDAVQAKSPFSQGFTIDGAPVVNPLGPLGGSDTPNIPDTSQPGALQQFQEQDRAAAEKKFVGDFQKQTPQNVASTGTDIVNTLKQMPAQIGLYMRYAIDNSFSGA